MLFLETVMVMVSSLVSAGQPASDDRELARQLSQANEANFEMIETLKLELKYTRDPVLEWQQNEVALWMMRDNLHRHIQSFENHREKVVKRKVRDIYVDQTRIHEFIAPDTHLIDRITPGNQQRTRSTILRRTRRLSAINAAHQLMVRFLSTATDDLRSLEELVNEGREIKLLPTKEIDGATCQGFAVTASNGNPDSETRYEIMVDPAAGYLVRHLVMEMDLEGIKFRHVRKLVEFTEVDGVFFPTRVNNQLFINGSIKSNTTYQVTELAINQPFDEKEWRFTFPENAMVIESEAKPDSQALSENAVLLIGKNGEVLKRLVSGEISQFIESLGPAEDMEAVAGPFADRGKDSGRRFYSIVVLVVIVAAFLLFLVWQRRGDEGKAS